MSRPEIAIIVSSYQRLGHLSRSLLSLARQEGVDGQFEVVVADDGSTDETRQFVSDFAREVSFPLHFTTHAHSGFQLSRCRNEGVQASTAPYLLFTDGDMLLPPDHVRIHLARRRKNFVQTGNCIRLTQAESEALTPEAIRSGAYAQAGSAEERKRVRALARKSWFYRLIRHSQKPKLFGGNIALWRSDYERVNGFDENFQGWGCEDDDLRNRLRAIGVQVDSILAHTHTLHLWHPIDPTAGKTWKDGPNVAYLLRAGRLTRCRNGLVKRDLAEMEVRVVADASQRAQVEQLAGRALPSSTSRKPEVEILVVPSRQQFSGCAELNILVGLDESPLPPAALQKAHIVIGPPLAGPTLSGPHWKMSRHFRLEELPQALAKLS